MSRHTYTVELSRGGDVPTWEGEATFSFTVTPGCAETRLTPAEDAEVENITLEEIDGKPRPWTGYGPVHDRFLAEEFEAEIEFSDAHLIAMLEIALADYQADRDEAAERLAELRAEP